MSQSPDPVTVSTSAAVQFCDLEATRWTWYREPRLRIMSTFEKTLSMRAIFNPGLTPPDFAEHLMANLDMLLPVFVSEHADRSIEELVKLSGLSQSRLYRA